MSGLRRRREDGQALGREMQLCWTHLAMWERLGGARGLGAGACGLRVVRATA